MDRRSFLKVLGAAGLAVAAPAAIVAAVVPRDSFTPTLTGFVFKRRSELMDYDQAIGLATGIEVDGEFFRHAIRLPTAAWKEFTPEQQEETWKLVERYTYDFAMRKAGGK